MYSDIVSISAAAWSCLVDVYRFAFSASLKHLFCSVCSFRICVAAAFAKIGAP